MIYFSYSLLPQLTNFRPEDSCKPLVTEDVNHLIDNIVFLLKKDKHSFWKNVTGHACTSGNIPASTARCFVKSLLFFFAECAHYHTPEQKALYEHAVGRVEEATGGFAIAPPHANCDRGEEEEEEEEEESVLRGGGRGDDQAHVHVPNHIRAWVDDEHLGSLVRCTPLVMVLLTEAMRALTLGVIVLFGFRRGHCHVSSGLECWVWHPRTQTQAQAEATDKRPLSSSRPLILFPGAGFGLTSFLPLALLLQRRLVGRSVVLYRFPWVEVCRPWVTLPQWSMVLEGLLEGFEALGLSGCEIDVLSHSYGTAVANRLLRELCRLEEDKDKGERGRGGGRGGGTSGTAPPRVHFLALLDPIVLGGASTGLSGFTINQVR